MPKLYELTAAYRQIDALIDDTETPNEYLMQSLQEIEGELKEKGENIGRLIENLESTAENMKAAEGRLSARRKAVENRAKAIRNYLLMNMVNSGIFKIECEYFKIAVRDNPASVVIESSAVLPPEYVRLPEPPKAEPDKRKILEDVTKHGLVLEGVTIEKTKRLEIR